MSVASIAITGSTSVWVAGLHIHEEPAGSATDPTASSRSGDRHETNAGSGFGDAIGDRREYGMMLSVLQLAPLSPFSSSPQE